MAKFDAVGIIVEDMRRALDFYRLLGLNVSPESDSEGHVEVELAPGFRALFDTIEVVKSFSSYEPATGGHRIGFAFSCETAGDVDDLFNRVVEAGYRAKTEPFDAFWGQRYATVIDPDGNPVDLYAALPT